MNTYILSMSCIGGERLQVEIHHRAGIIPWLNLLDHKSSVWTVIKHEGNPITKTTDITLEIEKEYQDKL